MANQDVQAVLRSQEYFRLKQVVESPGDIYELDESAKAIYIGPDSDVAEVQITYFNPDEPLALETAIVSVNGPFVGRIDSLPKTNVPSTGQPARILVSPVDYVDNNYIFAGVAPARQAQIPAMIDLIVALKELPDIPSTRADKTFRLPQVPYNSSLSPPPGTGGQTNLIIPIYGRRMVTVSVHANDLRMFTRLATLVPGTGLRVTRNLGDVIWPLTAPPSPFEKAIVIRSSDAARSWVTSSLATGLPIEAGNESDWPEEYEDGVTFPIPQPRGVCDLLILVFADTGAVAGPFTKFADVTIKISDRET